MRTARLFNLTSPHHPIAQLINLPPIPLALDLTGLSSSMALSLKEAAAVAMPPLLLVLLPANSLSSRPDTLSLGALLAGSGSCGMSVFL